MYFILEMLTYKNKGTNGITCTPFVPIKILLFIKSGKNIPCDFLHFLCRKFQFFLTEIHIPFAL